MQKYKWLFIVSLFMLVITNIFWFYKTLDNGITYTYQQVTLKEKSNQIDLLSTIVIEGAKGYTKKDILHILRQQNKDEFIVEEKNSIIIKGIKFTFKDGRLFEIKDQNE